MYWPVAAALSIGDIINWVNNRLVASFVWIWANQLNKLQTDTLSISPVYLYIRSSMVTQSDYVTLCDIYCRTVTQHLQIKYVVSRLILVWHWFAMRYRFTFEERGVKTKQKKQKTHHHPQRSCRCIWAHIDECVKLMYQAKAICSHAKYRLTWTGS